MKDPIVKMNGMEYRPGNFIELLNKYNLDGRTPILFNKLFNNDILNMNPQVDVFVIFSRVFDTLNSFELQSNYYDKVNKH